MKYIPLFIAAFALSACAATGEPYTPAKAHTGQSKVVVYRTPNGGSAPIEVNGLYKCRLAKNGYFVLDVPPSHPLTLTSSLLGDPFESMYTFTPRSGQTYYVRVEVNMASQLAGSIFGTVGGLVGGTAASAIATKEGSFLFRDGKEAEAQLTKRGC